MYKVLVVDDEPLVRVAMKSLMNWEEYGISMELEASNGKEAMKLLESDSNINVVITDINMPIMDGLELIEEIHKRKWPIEIIVLSAYDDYNLVRQAFKLGVNDYILKTEMEPDNVLKLLQEGIVRAENLKTENNKVKNSYSLDIKYLKNSTLKALLEEEYNKEIEVHLGDLDIKFGDKNITICSLLVDDYNEVSKRYEDNNISIFQKSVETAVSQYLTYLKEGEVVCLSPNEYAVIISFSEASFLFTRTKLLELINGIKHALSNYVNINVTIGVSDLKSGFNNISKLYSQAEKNAKLRFICGKGEIIFQEAGEKVRSNAIKNIPFDDNKFITYLRDGLRDKAYGELEAILSFILENKIHCSERVYTFYIKLISAVLNYASSNHMNSYDVFEEEVNYYEKLRGFETIKEINNWVKTLTDTVITYQKNNHNQKLSRPVLRAKEFIKENYSNQDLNLKMLSEHIGLSENHFCSVFTKEIGHSFTDYLTHFRIEKAKELILNTDFKVYEISEMVGYANTEHFSRVFKKVTGCSPNNYKLSK